eukprot:6097419-Pyramimonas_sp.AAC.1
MACLGGSRPPLITKSGVPALALLLAGVCHISCSQAQRLSAARVLKGSEATRAIVKYSSVCEIRLPRLSTALFLPLLLLLFPLLFIGSACWHARICERMCGCLAAHLQ